MFGNKRWVALVLVLLLALIAACAPPTPEVIEKEVVVEKPVVETVIVEKEVVVEKPVVETVIVEKPVVETVVVEATEEPVGWSDREFVLLQVLHPKEIDPMGPGNSTTDAWTKRMFYETLVEYSPNTGEMEGVLAVDWEVGPESKVYTFELREGVKFHDGGELTAEAVKLSFERFLSEGFARAAFLRGVDTIEAVDDLTVRITLAESDPIFMANMPDIFIASPKALKEHFDDDWFLTHEAGSSAYMLESPVPYESMTEVIKLQPFPDYWRGWGRDGLATVLPKGAKHLGPITSRAVPEPAPGIMLVQSGEAHMFAWYPIGYVQQLQAHPVVDAQVNELYRVALLPLNVGKPPLDDITLRKMLQAAFPYKGFQQYYYGMAQQAVGPIHPELLACEGLTPYEQDLDLARELLAEAGYEPGELTLSFLWPSGGGEKQKQPGVLLQDALREIGVELTVDTQPWANIVELVASGVENAPNIMTLVNTPKGADPGKALLWQFYHSDNMGGPYNWGYYDNPEFDEALDEAMAIADQDERYAKYCEIQRMVLEDATHIYLNYPPRIPALNREVGGLWQDPIGIDCIEFYDMYWKK